MGAPSVTAIRDAIAALHAVEYPAGDTVVLAGEQTRELVTLLSTLAVYANARERHDEQDRRAEQVRATLRAADLASADEHRPDSPCTPPTTGPGSW